MTYKNNAAASRILARVAFSIIVCAVAALGLACAEKAGVDAAASPNPSTDGANLVAEDAATGAGVASQTSTERKSKTPYPSFSDDEIAAAKDVVERYFEALNAGDADTLNALCTPLNRSSEVSQSVRLDLKRVDYDASDTIRESYLLYGRGSENGTLPENVIGFYTDYHVDTSAASLDAGAWEDGERTDWNFILVREGKDAAWLIDDQGY